MSAALRRRLVEIYMKGGEKHERTIERIDDDGAPARMDNLLVAINSFMRSSFSS